MPTRSLRTLLIALALLLSCVPFSAVLRSDARPSAQTTFRGALDVSALEARNVDLDAAPHLGRPSVHLRFKPKKRGEGIAILAGTSLLDGTIEADVAGRPEAGAAASARGFIGLAFRVEAAPDRFDCFYIRPTNGRVDDQLRRNHSTQYEAMPEFPWSRLRGEFPGVYESYADIDPGDWTHLRIEFAGPKARLYVNRAPQPALVVNDLKHEPTAGAIALWIGDETEGWFSNLNLTPR